MVTEIARKGEPLQTRRCGFSPRPQAQNLIGSKFLLRSLEAPYMLAPMVAVETRVAPDKRTQQELGANQVLRLRPWRETTTTRLQRLAFAGYLRHRTLQSLHTLQSLRVYWLGETSGCLVRSLRLGEHDSFDGMGL